MIKKFDFQNFYVHIDNNFGICGRARKGNKENKRTKGSMLGPLQDFWVLQKLTPIFALGKYSKQIDFNVFRRKAVKGNFRVQQVTVR